MILCFGVLYIGLGLRSLVFVFFIGLILCFGVLADNRKRKMFRTSTSFHNIGHWATHKSLHGGAMDRL